MAFHDPKKNNGYHIHKVILARLGGGAFFPNTVYTSSITGKN